MIPANDDVTMPDAQTVVKAEPAGATDEIGDQRSNTAPAIAAPDEHEEAGYGYGV